MKFRALLALASSFAAGGYLRLLPTAFGVVVQVDVNGSARPQRWRSVALLLGVRATAIVPARDLLY